MRSEHVGARRRAVHVRRLAWVLVVLSGFTSSASAGGGLFSRPARPAGPAYYVPTARAYTPPVTTVNEYGRLGTFYPTPVMTVRGNAPTGGGYSPLGEYGDTSMSLYGPMSSLRMTSAPVVTYSRGYDGRGVVQQGTSFSAPNLPSLTPVVNPTSASYYYGFRNSGSPPWWSSGINWLDQN